MDINIFFTRFHAALATVGRAGRGFSTTDLLTSLREELRRQPTDHKNIETDKVDRNPPITVQERIF